MHIAFYLNLFPTLSETFIRNQITGLIDLGHDVTVYSNANNDDAVWKLNDIKDYKLRELIKPKNITIPYGKMARIKMAWHIIKTNWNSNSIQIIEALNFFKHGKEAYNLNNLYAIAPFLGKPIDIMQCHFGHIANEVVILKKMKFPFKMQVMFHGFDIRLGIEEGGAIYAGLIEYADKIQSISSYNYQHLIEFGFSKEQITFHPVGIDLDKFPQKKRYHIDGPIQILSVGRLVFEKGYAHGLAAVAELIHKYKHNIHYTIIGDGSLRDDLLSLVAHLKIEKHVNFLGSKDSDEISEQLQKSDIFFLPSIAEALPVVLMEALSCGLPVVATNVGSVKELVLEGKNGFVAHMSNPESLVEKLQAILINKQDWEIMGDYGHQHIRNTYDIKQLNKKLITV
ncbi:glycosyltransferase [Gelidibacter sp. F2691]|nr:glycosyltransferase [Gelidibacter sp. F2691]